MASPGSLGFPDALVIRNCRIALPSGAVDVVLLPKSGPIKLVLVEAKVSSAADAGSKVIGQLLMYYAGALMLGAEGLQRLKTFAEKSPDVARQTARISPKKLTDGMYSSPEDAWEALYQGKKLEPEEIRLFIALNGKPHRALEPTLAALKQHHRIAIELIFVMNGKVLPPMKRLVDRAKSWTPSCDAG